MLVSLHVKNLAIIEEIEVDFQNGLNILTGETGAGKSIIIGSINIALGGKASGDLIRTGAQYGLVELVFQMEKDSVYEKLRQMELPVEDDQIILSRKIMKNRSICRVNGETVTIGMVREIAGLLIDLHGQHENQSLLHKRNHLEILDRFCKEEFGDNKERLKSNYQDMVKAQKEYNDKNLSEDERIRELSFMEYEMNEIEQAHLQEGEEEELMLAYKRMSNAQLIMENVRDVYQITAGGVSSVSDEIGRAQRQLSKVADFDERLSECLSQLESMEELLNDFNYEMNAYADEMNYDEEQLREVEERLSVYHSLKAKYGDNISDIQEYYNQMEEKVEQYKEYDLYLQNLKERLERKEKNYRNIAGKMSKVRKKNAKILSEKIKQALIDLNFLDVQFEVRILENQDYTENGIDDVEFLISTNPGEQLKPLGKVASGGELSRIMLALKSVLADQDAVETLIFDEIDAGISGRTAQKVSEKMAVIAGKHQIICITHLPQIAAMADAHFIIEKKVEGTSTVTDIRTLDTKGSITELARILGGAEITDTVLETANEMKEMAASLKSNNQLNHIVA